MALELTSQRDRILHIGPTRPVTQTGLHNVVGDEFGAFRGVVEELHSRVLELIHRVVVHRRDAAVRGWRRSFGTLLQVVAS